MSFYHIYFIYLIINGNCLLNTKLAYHEKLKAIIVSRNNNNATPKNTKLWNNLTKENFLNQNCNIYIISGKI